MPFLSTILLLLGLAFAIATPLFFGHALSNEHGRQYFLYSGITLVIAAAIIAAHVRSLRGRQ